MKIGVGSTNPVKVEAVQRAITNVVAARGVQEAIEIQGFLVASGVAAQPFSEEETLLGARNRAQAILDGNPEIELACGLEGGVQPVGKELYSTVWVVVRHRSGSEQVVNGARFPLPEDIAQSIRDGEEMGVVMSRRVNRVKVNESEGMIGILTGGVIDRMTEYSRLAELALALWYERTTPSV